MPSPGFEPGSGERQRAVSGSALDLTAIRAGPYGVGQTWCIHYLLFPSTIVILSLQTLYL